jgi:hypothetical protein
MTLPPVVAVPMVGVEMHISIQVAIIFLQVPGKRWLIPEKSILIFATITGFITSITDEKLLHLLMPERYSASKLIYSSILSDQFTNS